MREIHPVIRIVSFAVLTAFLALGGAADIAVGAALLIFLYAKLEGRALQAAWRLLRRMRWLFLSIAIIYLWFTPGTPLIPGDEAFAQWLPTVDGARQGGLRILALALMAAAASLLLHVTPSDQILGALRWLMAPLGVMGFPHERLAVRAALTLDAVTRVQEHVRAALAARRETAKPIARIGAVAATVFAIVMSEAEGASCMAIELPAPYPPPIMQWSLPLLLFVLMTAAVR